MSTKLTTARNLFELLRPLAPRRTARAPASTAGTGAVHAVPSRPGPEDGAPRHDERAQRDGSPRTARMKVA